ncbi:HNH endonuclease signature motif containing protein [Actinomyces faecalis]|uniref:HNH endonuclease signature motif containing protein n=1 Tax=Actinomyces faecalis TaxID=2722820 RepID=UPI0015532101|nr:HNH endonuclease signature motif containing protein [Actinomyces faecalis]
MFDSVSEPSPATSRRPARERAATTPAAVKEEERLALLATVPPGGPLASCLDRILQAALPRPDVDTFDASSAPGGDLAGAEVLSASERVLLLHSQVAPGEPLAAVEHLAGLGLETLSELVAACERLTSWSCWIQSLLAAAMTRSVETQPVSAQEAGGRPDLRPGSYVSQEGARLVAASEIACRLGISTRRAGQLIERGQSLCLPALSAAAGLHRSGLIDAAKAALLAGRLEHVSHEVAVQVQDQVLPRAPHRTHTQLARDLDRALAACDPEGTCQRRRRNAEHRYVSRPRPAGEGVCEMRLVLPVLDAALVDATLDAIAGSARATGDGRSVSQLRADAVVSMTLSLLRREQHEACRPAASPPGCLPGGRPEAASGSGSGSASDPGAYARTVTWAGSASHSQATGSHPALADGVPLLPLLAGLSTLVSSTSPWWTPSGSAPVLFPSGLQVQVDVTVPVDYLAEESFEATSASSPDEPAGATGSVRHPSVLRPPVLSVQIGRHTLPVPSYVATALASGGTWRRLLTDPVSGAVLDVGRRRYRPPASLAEAVRARDHTCTHPGCTVPARGCDLDHVVPWSAGGATSFDNLTLLCQAHHRLKHTPGWSLTRLDDGALLWRTPSGARYRRDPDGGITMLARRTGPRSVHRDVEAVPARLAEAVNESVIAQIDHGLAQTMSQAPGGSRSPGQWQTRGPRPGEPVGAWRSEPYAPELHELGLDVLLDELVPFSPTGVVPDASALSATASLTVSCPGPQWQQPPAAPASVRSVAIEAAASSLL